MSNWWADKLTGQQAPSHGITVQPVVQQQQQFNLPPGYVAVPVQQVQQHVHQQQAPQQVEDPNRKLSLREAVTRFKGGEGTKTEGDLACPACGSKTGYTEFRGMAGLSAGVMGNRPAPHCYECGFNGKFMQGDQSNWAT